MELLKHRNKLIHFTSLSPQELEELEFLVKKNIIFINEGLLPEKIFIASENLLSDIDLNDTPFVALTKHLKAKLWSGDKKLLAGPQAKKFKDIITTSQLSQLLDELER